jgi:RND family efflux transporter MFP subunit
MMFSTSIRLNPGAAAFRCLRALLAFLLLVETGHAAELEALLQWSRRVELSFPVNGVIKEVAVEPGQKVNRGEVLAQLDSRTFVSELRLAEAQLNSEKERLAEARRELDRAKELYERTVLSDHDLQMAELEVARALADYEVARNHHTHAGINLELSAIRAPFPALVIDVAAQPGQTVVSDLKPEQQLILAEAGAMLAQSSIGLDELAGLEPGQSLDVEVAGTRYPGTLLPIGLEQLATEGGDLRYPLRVWFATGDTLLRAGQPARILLP